MSEYVLSTPPLCVPMPFNKYYLDMRLNRGDVNDNHHVLIGIMDTGVDPGAVGLTRCPDGTNKIINVIDCTGSDDIVVKNVKIDTIDSIGTGNNQYHDAIIKCLTERSLIDREYELYFGVRSLRSFVSDRIFNTFDEKRQGIINNIVINVVVITILNTVNDLSNEPRKSSLAIIDYDGEPNNYICLNEYQIDQQYGSIPLEDNLDMNFGYHLYNDDTYDANVSELNQKSKICSLVFDTGGHGTHVAGIVGGNFTDETMNGIDPNCHILSLKIGDSRVNGMETSISLMRAMRELVKHNCHIVNYSFGEPIGSDKGRVIDLINDYVYRYNITFVTSAGNSGPNITTIGAPGSITDRTINVGAWMDRRIVENHHFIVPNDNYNESPSTWSARGPGFNDSMGVDVVAPGCALTSHPDWFASKLKMCRGTSMASPNVTGFLSLIIKSLFRNSSGGIYHHPHAYWLKRYLEETCGKIQSNVCSIDCKKDDNKDDNKDNDKNNNTVRLEAFSQGHGLIGQNIIDIDQFFSRTDYMYDFVINNNAAKKGIFNIDEEDESETHPGINYHTISVKIVGRKDLLENNSSSFKLNEMVHRLYLEPDDSIRSSIILVNDVVVYPGSMSIHIGVKKNSTISGYIKIYEVLNKELSRSDMRYVASIPVNQFMYTIVERNDSVTLGNKKIQPGETLRHYFMPKCSTLSFSLSGEIENKISIDVIQVYQGTGYDKRSLSRTFTKKELLQKNQITFNYDVVQHVLTEIVINSPFESPVVETIKLKVTGLMKNVKLGKHLYEIGETVVVNVGKYLDDTDHNVETIIRSAMKIDSILTKYHPVRAEILDCNEHLYADLDQHNKKLKTLRLTYAINDHVNCTYAVNTGNKIYDSSVSMQGFVQGFKDNRYVFCANYIPKKVTKYIDTIWVDFIDHDVDQLKKFISTVLTAHRVPSKKISMDVNLRKGINFIDLSNNILSNDILNNLEEVYSGDYLQTSILDESFLIMYCKPPELSVPPDDPEHQSIKTILTDFRYVKDFLNKICDRQIFDLTDQLSKIKPSDDILKVLTFASDIMSDTHNESHKKYVTICNQSDRDAYHYIGTITTNFHQIKSTYNYFHQKNQLTKNQVLKSMLLVLDLAQSIDDKKPIKDILKKITTIESNKKYWINNCLSLDFDTLRCGLINGLNSDKDNLIVKRKATLITLTNEQIVW